MFKVGDRIKWGKEGGFSWMSEDKDFYGVVVEVRSTSVLRVTVEDYDPSPFYRTGVYVYAGSIEGIVHPVSLENK